MCTVFLLKIAKKGEDCVEHELSPFLPISIYVFYALLEQCVRVCSRRTFLKCRLFSLSNLTLSVKLALSAIIISLHSNFLLDSLVIDLCLCHFGPEISSFWDYIRRPFCHYFRTARSNHLARYSPRLSPVLQTSPHNATPSPDITPLRHHTRRHSFTAHLHRQQLYTSTTALHNNRSSTSR